MIQCLSIQILLDLAGDFDRNVLLNALHTLGCYPEIDEDEEEGKWVAFNLFSEDLVALWAELQPALFESAAAPVLETSGIIVCEGDDGWSDDRLLFHHNPDETTDSFT